MHGKGSTVEERVKASAGLVATFLQSWSGASPSPLALLASGPELTPSHAGLFYLNIHGRQALTSLVDSLTNPSQVIRVRRSDPSPCPSRPPAADALLPAGYAPRHALRRLQRQVARTSRCVSLSSAGLSRQVADSRTLAEQRRSSISTLSGPSSASGPSANAPQRRTNLIDQFMAVLLLIFVEAGLIEVRPPPAALSPAHPAKALTLYRCRRLSRCSPPTRRTPRPPPRSRSSSARSSRSPTASSQHRTPSGSSRCRPSLPSRRASTRVGSASPRATRCSRLGGSSVRGSSGSRARRRVAELGASSPLRPYARRRRADAQTDPLQSQLARGPAAARVRVHLERPPRRRPLDGRPRVPQPPPRERRPLGQGGDALGPGRPLHARAGPASQRAPARGGDEGDKVHAARARVLPSVCAAVQRPAQGPGAPSSLTLPRRLPPGA